MQILFQDIRYGLRVMLKSPGFTAVAVLTLSIGIGVNVGVFTLIHAIMLQSLPVANPNQLYRLGDNNNCCQMTGLEDSWTLYSYPLYRQLRDETSAFTDIAAFQTDPSDLSVRRPGGDGPAQPYRGEFVSGNYFRMFGIKASVGRIFIPSDDVPAAPPTVLMSYRTWQQDFGLDTKIVGSTVTINGQPFTVVGIAPPGFFGDTLRSDPPDVWLPLSTEPRLTKDSQLERADLEWLYSIGRLKSGALARAVQAQLTLELQRWLEQTAAVHDRNEIKRQHITLTPAAGGVDRMREDYAQGLELLALIAGLVLVITCANLASLLLTRGVSRSGQLAVRLALGAPRHRILREGVIESLLIGIIGGAVGLLVSTLLTRAVLVLAFSGASTLPIGSAPSLPVLVFALLLSMLSGVVFGMVPAWVACRTDPASALQSGLRTVTSRSRIRGALVTLQVAISVVLVTAAGLLALSLRNLHTQNFGFETSGRLIVRVDPSLAGYTRDRLSGLYSQLQERLERIPGVRSASFSNYSPMQGQNWNESIYVEGHPPNNWGRDTNSSLNRVGPHYFTTIGTHLLRGRSIEEVDTASSSRVAVVNEAFVREFLPGQDPIGQHFGIGDARNSGDYEIVGIVEDSKYQDARVPAYAMAFMPMLQSPPGAPVNDGSIYINDIELDAAGSLQNLEPSVRRAIAEIDPNLAILQMTSFTDQFSRNFGQDTLITRLTEFFGILALILAAIGLYGITSYAVQRRTKEMGLRMTFGATRGSLLRLVLGRALMQVFIGLVIGLPVALGASRVLGGLLYGISRKAPLIAISAAMVLVICAVAAAAIPAWRACRIDPMAAVRYE
jgi:predicted permease